MELLEPKEIVINDATYRIGKFPAVAGREIITKYPLSNIPRVGDYAVSEEIMLKLMSYVERVLPDGTAVRLSTKELVNNHVPSWETLVKLEAAALEHNCSFFQNGKSAAFFEKLGTLAQRKVTEILTSLLETSSRPAKPHSGN
ncbi:MAG: hypothetical protein Q4P84_00065 [Elusimicrobiales bacterium]|uniref:hypothetical protein n=1 Tax=Candidatus Avelusimicrobium sp. TaxID=3048833 RepID=UPI0026F542A0|nr:hypothetical protein [Elusimicrobiales bacterium]